MATYKPKNILITGAAGFIASHVANRLIRNYPEYKIVVLDKLDYCSNLKNLYPSRSSPNFKFVKGDIGSADLVNYLLITESIDTIMHFAAQTHVDNSFGNSFEFTKNNIYGTHVLLEACKVTGQIRRFIHVSTDEVYGETDEDAIVGNHEASQLLPTNPYSATKAGAEMLVMAYGRSYGLPVITTRGNNVYGPNQFPEKLIPKFILLAMRGQPLPIHGDGSNVRSYLYCEDVAEAFEVVLHRGEVGHVYNIGTKKERRVIDVAKDICKLFSLDPNTVIKFVENRPFNDQRYFLEDQKLKNLGWSERTTWEEGLKKTMEWYTSNPDWWGDVTGALLPHPRMLMMPGTERQFDGSENITVTTANVSSNSGQSRMVVPVSRSSSFAQKPSLKFLIYGRTGWIGGLLGKICEKQGIAFEYGKGRLEERSQLLADILNVKPTHVFNAAGVTGRPNVDWCESHKPETIRTNVVGTLNLADICREQGLLMMNFATGCIFEYDAEHPEGSGIGFKEEDKPNFTGSFYSKTKAMVEELVSEYDNVCTLRVRMPISSDLSNPRNFITKISRYSKVVNIPNSMTILDELLPISVEMAKRNCRGIWNFTNPGVVSHNEILEMYKSYIDPEFKWVNFTLEEQAKAEKSERWFKKVAELHDVTDLASAISDEDFPEIMPMRKGENRFVVSRKKDRSLTSPQYKRRMAMEQSNSSNFVPFVPFPPDYFAKKDKQPENGVPNEKASSETLFPEKVPDMPKKSETSNIGSVNFDNQQTNPDQRSAGFPANNLNENKVDAAYRGPAVNSAQQSNNLRTNPGVSWSSGLSGKEHTVGSSTQQSENTQNRQFTGKSLEGSLVKEPDPLDMSEEAKAERWFRRVAQIKDISELSQIPDEDFPSIMPMRKGVNRFVVSKRKTPLERRLTSPQYRRNLPIVSSEPTEKKDT